MCCESLLYDIYFLFLQWLIQKKDVFLYANKVPNIMVICEVLLGCVICVNEKDTFCFAGNSRLYLE